MSFAALYSGAAFSSCPGDFNGDGKTKTADKRILQQHLGHPCPAPCVYDLNADGKVNRKDVQKLAMLPDCQKLTVCGSPEMTAIVRGKLLTGPQLSSARTNQEAATALPEFAGCVEYSK